MPYSLSKPRSRELALNMLLNALDALENRPGDDSRMAARLWVMRATALLREAREDGPFTPDARLVDALLLSVSQQLSDRAAGCRLPVAEGRFSRFASAQAHRAYAVIDSMERE